MSSVRPSVTLVDCDYIGWNSFRIILRLVTLGSSFSADPNIMHLFQGEHPEILPGIGVGWVFSSVKRQYLVKTVADAVKVTINRRLRLTPRSMTLDDLELL